MKKYLMMLVALMTTLFAASAFAFSPPSAPAQGWYVVDQAGKLSPSQMDTINHRILAISQVTRNEFGVLILQSLEGDSIEDASYSTFRSWGVGKHGLDNGCLLVISVADRKMRIETGKGVGGEVTDIQAKDILDQNLRPALRQGDFAGGILATLGALDRLMESRHTKAADAQITRDLGTRNLTASAPVTAPQPVAQTPVLTPPPAPVTAPTVTSPVANQSNDSGAGIFLALLGVVVVLGGGFAIFAYLSSKREEEERQLAAQRERLAEQARAAARQAIPSPRSYTAPAPQHHVPAPTPKPYVAPKPYVRPETYYVAPPVAPVASSAPAPVQSDNGDIAAAALAAAAAAAAMEDARYERQREQESRQREQERDRRERENQREEERRAKAREEEEDRRRRDREDDDRRSSESSSSSWSSSDSGSSWGGGDSGGGGFGGGDSGGGGASSDW